MNIFINDLLISIRKWKGRLFYFSLGVLGLSVAIAVMILALGFLEYELTFDKSIEKNRTFLIHEKDEDNSFMANISLGRTLMDYDKNVEASTVVSFGKKAFFKNKEQVISQDFALVSPTFFQVFPYSVRHGDLSDMLKPNEIVLTERTAIAYFGRADVVGELLKCTDNLGFVDSYIIKAVLEDFSQNTSVQSDIFYVGFNPKSGDHLNGKSLMAYNWIRLKENLTLQEIQQIADIFKSRGEESIGRLEYISLGDLHFSDYDVFREVFNAKSKKYIIILIGITCLLLVISSLNTINLTLARSSEFNEEIRTRRVLGAQKIEIIRLFFLDNIILFICSLPVAYLFAYWGLPYFSNTLNVPIEIGTLFQFRIFAVVLLLTIFLSIPCALYPALTLMKEPSLGSSSNSNGINKRVFSFKEIIVAVQYSASIILIVLVIIMKNQIFLLNNRPIGFQKEHLLMLPDISLRSQYHAFKHELLRLPDVVDVTSSNVQVGELKDKETLNSRHDIQTIVADFDFAKTLGLNVRQGEYFNPHDAFQKLYNSDYMMLEPGKENEYRAKLRERPIVVTQDLLNRMNIADPIGRIIEIPEDKIYGRIIGVLEPFEMGPQRNANIPKIILGDFDSFYGGHIYVRIANSNVAGTIQKIKGVWNDFVEFEAFDYDFTDEVIDNLYKSEMGMANLTSVLSLISGILSIAGILSLLSLTIIQRMKEIGIRKVLGASNVRINKMIILDILKPVLIAVIISVPFSYFLVVYWLQDFSYKVELNFFLFAFPVMLILIITTLIVNILTFRAARINPVHLLRDK